MALETEIARYDELLPQILPGNEGKFAVIVGRELVGIYNTSDDGWMAGYRRVGLKPFLLRAIQKTRPAIWLPSLMRKVQHDPR